MYIPKKYEEIFLQTMESIYWIGAGMKVRNVPIQDNDFKKKLELAEYIYNKNNNKNT